MAKSEIIFYILAGMPKVGEYTYINSISANDETIWICRIMKFWNRCDLEITDQHRLMCCKRMNLCLFKFERTITQSFFIDINRQRIFFRDHTKSGNMITVFMRNKNSFHLFHL